MALTLDTAEPRIDGEVLIENQLDRPRRFKVLLHNDDYTTMEFVVHVLMTVFGKTQNEASQVMLKVHNEGVGICGVYTAEIAEAKVALVHHLARKNGFPLKCTMEEV
ncbi:MAG TPA: ATP-dependent Clp protease adapter ClpS [Desulfonatronum sp.]|nr:ATP-dependent Clp protease adapter ClpS [Desulfonatronum sp.]